MTYKIFKIFILIILIELYTIFFLIVDVNEIKDVNSQNFIYFSLSFILLYLYVHIRFNLTKFYIPISPFFLYSFFFWWIPFYLLFFFSTYRVSPLIYQITLLSFTSVISAYELFSFILPSINEKIFIKKIKKARISYFKNQKIYDDFWKISLFFSFVFTTLFFIKAGNIPMFASNPEIARVEAMKGSGTIQRFSYLTLHFGVISYMIIVFLKNKRISFFIISIIVFLVFYNMLTGPRSYALWALVFIYITYQLLHFKKLKIMHGFMLLSFILFIVALVGGLRYSGMDNVNIDDTLIRFVNRIYMNPVNADRIVNYFLNKSIDTNSFLIELSVLLPGYQPDLGTYLKELFGVEFDGGGITVPLPSEGYMNYGLVGVVIYSILFSLILKIYEIFIYIIKPTVFTILFMIILPVQFMGIITMGISGILVKTTIPVIIVFLTMYTLTNLLEYIRKHYAKNRR